MRQRKQEEIPQLIFDKNSSLTGKKYRNWVFEYKAYIYCTYLLFTVGVTRLYKEYYTVFITHTQTYVTGERILAVNYMYFLLFSIN
jgi:hypothetical protein